MKITSSITESVLLAELGGRLARIRLEKNLTQDELAREAGIGLRTLQRLESGSVASRLSSFVRVCRVLGLAGNLDLIAPESGISPMAQLKRDKALPQRAGRKKKPDKENGRWSWGE
ncbi:MAG: helix-turn-helix transcriptional regulator [Opitutales bacterium]|nr:helix-turn-helix transcriptional regulator [Opitutales bacterium]